MRDGEGKEKLGRNVRNRDEMLDALILIIDNVISIVIPYGSMYKNELGKLNWYLGCSILDLVRGGFPKTGYKEVSRHAKKVCRRRSTFAATRK